MRESGNEEGVVQERLGWGGKRGLSSNQIVHFDKETGCIIQLTRISTELSILKFIVAQLI